MAKVTCQHCLVKFSEPSALRRHIREKRCPVLKGKQVDDLKLSAINEVSKNITVHENFDIAKMFVEMQCELAAYKQKFDTLENDYKRKIEQLENSIASLSRENHYHTNINSNNSSSQHNYQQLWRRMS